MARSLRKRAYATFQDIRKAYVTDCEPYEAEPHPYAKSSAFCEAVGVNYQALKDLAFLD